MIGASTSPSCNTCNSFKAYGIRCVISRDFRIKEEVLLSLSELSYLRTMCKT